MAHSYYGQYKLKDIENIDAEKYYLRYLALQAALSVSSSECLLAEKVKVKRLRKKDVGRAAQTLVNAIENDPLEIYMRDTPDARRPRLYKRIQRLQYTIALSQFVERKWGLTVDNGRAIVCGLSAPETDKRSKRDRKIDALYRLGIRLLDLVGKSKQQRRRSKHVNQILTKFTTEALGADLTKMRSINTLATSPDFQGRGYGGALVDAVTKMADSEGRSTYLLSSNPANTEFYNSHGFFTIADVLIGADDPTWVRPPVLIPLMVRICGDQ